MLDKLRNIDTTDSLKKIDKTISNAFHNDAKEQISTVLSIKFELIRVLEKHHIRVRTFV